MSELTREIRLNVDEIYAIRALARKRIRELEKRLERSSYEGKPGMLQSVLDEKALMTQIAYTFDHNHNQIARQLARVVGVE